jgi:hypothetical protein
VSANATGITPQANETSCGLHHSLGNGTVATSPAGSAFTVTVGEPSWDEVCGESGQGGVALPAYEVFPITILATPNLTLVLQTGRATVSSQQVAEGASNGSVWTGFDPAR